MSDAKEPFEDYVSIPADQHGDRVGTTVQAEHEPFADYDAVRLARSVRSGVIQIDRSDLETVVRQIVREELASR